MSYINKQLSGISSSKVMSRSYIRSYTDPMNSILKAIGL